MSERVRIRVVASGTVQGVFFRASTRDEALRRDVTGWVRNRPDGAVEAELQGTPDDVAAMVAFVRGGPGHAHVAQVDETPLAVLPDERGFAVR